MLRLREIFTIILLFIVQSCVFITHSTSENNRRSLPTLHRGDYGTIEYVDNYTGMKSKLNRLWGQEASANPEARSLMQAMQHNGFPFVEPELGIIDSGMHIERYGHPRFTQQMKEDIAANYDTEIKPMMEKIVETAEAVNKYHKKKGIITNNGDSLAHGTKTLGIFVGKEPAGMSSQGLVSYLSFDFYNFFYKEAPMLVQKNNLPAIINLSLGIGSFLVEDVAGGGERVVRQGFDAEEYASFIHHAEQVIDKTILVKSAGNDFPQPVDNMIRDLGDKMIVVGSADPGGFPSHFSQTSTKVTVLAPSDNYLQSITNHSKLTRYGGTSGATPMVSAVLADVKSILPDLNRDEAVYMLKKTATRTSINSVSDVNGAGVLNHYKMLRVAERLHLAGFADNRGLLYDDMFYDFADEANKLQRDAQQLLKTSKDADSYSKAFKQLRVSFFLDGNNMKTRKALAKFYRRAGHIAEAELYDEPVKFTKSIARFFKQKHIRNLHKKHAQRMKMSTQDFIYNEIDNFIKWVDRNDLIFEPKAIKERDKAFAAIKSSATSMTEEIVHPEMLNNTRALKMIIMHTQKLIYEGEIEDNMLKLVLEYTNNTMPQLLTNKELIKYLNLSFNKSTLQKIANKLEANSDLLRVLKRIII